MQDSDQTYQTQRAWFAPSIVRSTPELSHYAAIGLENEPQSGLLVCNLSYEKDSPSSPGPARNQLLLQRPPEDGHSDDNPVGGKWGEASRPYPVHKPGDYSVSNHKADYEANRERNPVLGA